MNDFKIIGHVTFFNDNIEDKSAKIGHFIFDKLERENLFENEVGNGESQYEGYQTFETREEAFEQYHCKVGKLQYFATAILNDTNTNLTLDCVVINHKPQPTKDSSMQLARFYAEIYETHSASVVGHVSVALYDTRPHKPMYQWFAVSNDGAYEDCSDKPFETKEECYNDMRNAVLEKMKWNTEFAHDFADTEHVYYHVSFSQNKITHESYSGIYTYKIREIHIPIS